MRNKIILLPFVFSICSSLSFSTMASDDPNDSPREQRVPPREAFTACDGKAEGDQVTFTTPRGETLTGHCKMLPARLAAVPDHPPQGHQGGPDHHPQ